MHNPTIKLSRPQLISALSQFPPEALKKLIDAIGPLHPVCPAAEHQFAIIN